MTGVPMLTRPLVSTSIADARINVLIAPGADLTAASGSWSFTDVTTDVMFKDDVTISVGRADEQSEAQTASLKLTLLNDAGNYTPRRRQGSFWPNMRLGFPVKVSVWSTTTGDVELFTGYADELAPSWNVSMNVPTVSLTAKGTIQRLQQGAKPLQSVISLAALDSSLIGNVAAYWPGTDAESSSQIGSGLDRGSPMGVTGGAMKFAAFDGFPGSEPIMTFGAGASIHGTVLSSPSTSGNVYFRCLLSAATTLADGAVMLRLSTTGTIKTWRLLYNTGGAMSLKGFDASDAEVFNRGPVAFNIDGTKFYMSVEFDQNGADIDYLVSTTTLKADGTTGFGLITGTVTSQTVGASTSVDMGASGTMTDWSVGHIGVANTQSWLFASSNLMTGYNGELVSDRVQRLCDQVSVPVAITGTSSIRMGPQSRGTLIDALKECETADHGLLFDGVGFGLGYICRSARENAAVGLALNIASGHLMPPFEPVENTRLVRNDVTVTRKEGSSARAVQASGQPYAPDTAGRFDTSVTVNVSSDDNLSNHAGWLLALGTIDQDRYPNLSLDLAASSPIALDWLTKGKLGARVTVTGLPATGGADPDVFIEGIETTIGPQVWEASVNCSPATPYDVGVLDNAGGTYAADHVVLDTASSTVNTSALAGATSLSVASGSGVLWTTSASHLPLYLSVDGWKVQVTAISGASSPQTFTVSALPAAVAAGKQVKLWSPNLLAL